MTAEERSARRGIDPTAVASHAPIAAAFLPAVVALVLAGMPAVDAAELGSPNGAVVYQKRCARCHGESGIADSPESRALKVRPLRGDPQLARMSAASIANAVATNPKHRALKAIDDVPEAERDAAADFVKLLAGKR